MQFDKSKVYTALNADELKVGSKCIFADTVKRLSELVESDDMQEHVYVLIAVLDDDKAERFEIDHTTYSLAYLVEPPKEPEYKPFSSTEKALEAIRKHGGWVKNKNYEYLFFITGIDIGVENGEEIQINNNWYSVSHLVDIFVFLGDGSPCGELAADLGIILQE